MWLRSDRRHAGERLEALAIGNKCASAISAQGYDENDVGMAGQLRRKSQRGSTAKVWAPWGKNPGMANGGAGADSIGVAPAFGCCSRSEAVMADSSTSTWLGGGVRRLMSKG